MSASVLARRQLPPGTAQYTVRQAFASTAAGATRDVVVAFPVAFADTNYTVAVNLRATAAANWWEVDGTRTTSSVTIRVQNLTGLLLGLLGVAITGTVDLTVTHD